jgi:acetyltransferase-like isoleucine patch superfamily enzyme
MNEAQRAHHDDIVRMYEEQDELHEKYLKDRKPVIHEPVTIIKPEVITIHPTARIDSHVKLEGGDGMTIGAYVHIASFAHIGIGGGTTILEDGSAFASGSKVISGSNLPEAPSMSAIHPDAKVRKSVTRIGKNACVATNATVLPGVELGEGAILAAGSVATKDIPPFEIWAGVPARKIGDRRER